MKKLSRVILIVVLVALVIGAGALAYRFWYQPTYDYFSTNDATVTGSFVRVAAPASGQVYDLLADQGTTVRKGDVLGTIQVVSQSPSASRLLAYVTSPISGTLAARNVSVGETVAAGQSVASIVDLQQLWVVANVDESRVAEIHIGQFAEVQIGDVGRTFRGQVTALGSATTNVLSPSISLTSSSDTTQKVPVKIAFDYNGVRLVPGMSASVTIRFGGTH